jgi:predicted HicB family RNase H-like nuclease
MQKTPKKYLNMIIPAEIHRELKQRALDRNVTVSKYVIDAIMMRLKNEK